MLRFDQQCDEFGDLIVEETYADLPPMECLRRDIQKGIHVDPPEDKESDDDC